jgi:hypothetical protein
VSNRDINDINDELGLVANQVAETEALLSFIINAARTNTNYEDFRKALDDNLEAVKLDLPVDVEAYLDTFTEGYVVTYHIEDPVEGTNKVDYLRDDDGLPIVFGPSDVVPAHIKVAKVIDLAERNNNDE